MSENILFCLARSRLRADEETVESWKAEHREAVLARDVEDIVLACLDYPGLMARLWNSALPRIRDHQITDLQQAGEALGGLFDGTLDFLGSLRQWTREFEAAGHNVQGARELDRVIEQLQEMKKDVLAHWPWFSEKDVEEARAAHARGECLELDEAFATIADVDKETWRERVEEYKRAKRSDGQGSAR